MRFHLPCSIFHHLFKITLYLLFNRLEYTNNDVYAQFDTSEAEMYFHMLEIEQLGTTKCPPPPWRLQ